MEINRVYLLYYFRIKIEKFLLTKFNYEPNYLIVELKKSPQRTSKVNFEPSEICWVEFDDKLVGIELNLPYRYSHKNIY